MSRPDPSSGADALASAFLTSRRLYFRTWTQADVPLASSLWSDPEVARYLGGPMSPEAVAARLDLEMHRQQTLGIQYWPIFDTSTPESITSEFAGCAGLRPFHQEPHLYEVGVHIGHRFWGAQLGEEAALAVIRFAFENLGALALTAGHNPENSHPAQ